MEKYLVLANPSNFNPSTEIPRPIKRHRWKKRSLIELNGRFEPNYRHYLSGLIIQSYSEVEWFINAGLSNDSSLIRRQGVSSLEFDSKGVYLASVTKLGCLTVHDFENIQCPDSREDETKQVMHISTCQQLDVIRWNPANQDEIACTSMKSSEVHIFDIGYISSEPIEVLRKRPNITVHGFNLHKGFSDIAFSSDDNSRLLASDTNGVINVWDRRASDLPCLELKTNSSGTLNSIKLSGDNEEFYSPLMTVKLAHELEKISHLKAQSNIVSKEIHSIDIDPSCPYQLAFHLDDGWSGVLDTNKLQVTHIHCPPPPWFIVIKAAANVKFIASSEDIQSTNEAKIQQTQNRYLSLSESVTACAAHPMNGTIVAGTKLSSLLVISQMKTSC
ncbi:hypothetical protein BUALT_Bualt13G0031800 [Buddleja alternifolia]|uniref:Uncharacterized protein n=1 Tax=Buddleja alternifolia TaxID=168488 RepID=A0AAV6WK18_9LAMI|nr:hypothetical protein BUALT_Bualt13G0031800 [Buddleja alternifolia]